eukprot:UC1_evm1s1211
MALTLLAETDICVANCTEKCVIFSSGDCQVPSTVPPQASQSFVVEIAVASSLSVLVLLLVVVVFVLNRRLRRRLKAHDFDGDLRELIMDVDMNDRIVPREVPRSSISFLEEL